MSDQVEITPELAAAAARAFFRLHKIILDLETMARAGDFPNTDPALIRGINMVHIQMHQLLPPESLEDTPA